jgi:hypothetical protein
MEVLVGTDFFIVEVLTLIDWPMCTHFSVGLIFFAPSHSFCRYTMFWRGTGQCLERRCMFNECASMS